MQQNKAEHKESGHQQISRTVTKTRQVQRSVHRSTVDKKRKQDKTRQQRQHRDRKQHSARCVQMGKKHTHWCTSLAWSVLFPASVKNKDPEHCQHHPKDCIAPRPVTNHESNLGNCLQIMVMTESTCIQLQAMSEAAPP